MNGPNILENVNVALLFFLAITYTHTYVYPAALARETITVRMDLGYRLSRSRLGAARAEHAASCSLRVRPET